MGAEGLAHVQWAGAVEDAGEVAAGKPGERQSAGRSLCRALTMPFCKKRGALQVSKFGVSHEQSDVPQGQTKGQLKSLCCDQSRVSREFICHQFVVGGGTAQRRGALVKRGFLEYYTLTRMAKIKNDDTKCWQGCEEIRALIHCR